MDETETDVVEAAGRHRERDRLAPDHERAAGLGLVHAGEHLDQRRLAAAVLAEQGVDLSVCHGEARTVECSGGAELLGYVGSSRAVSIGGRSGSGQGVYGSDAGWLVHRS